MKYRYPLVEVLWDDPQGDAAWKEIPAELKPTPMMQIGFLVKKTDKHIMLAACYQTQDKEVSSSDVIPIGAVLSIKELIVYPKHENKI